MGKLKDILMSTIFGINLMDMGIHGVSRLALVGIALCLAYFALTFVGRRLGLEGDGREEWGSL